MSLSFLSKRRAFLVFILLGLSVLVVVALLKPAPSKNDDYNPAPIVNYTIVEKRIIDPVINGFGRAFPDGHWTAISEVTGRVVYRHPELEKGRTISAGTEVLRIDPVDYQLALAQSRATLKAAELERKRIDFNQRTFQQNLTLANTQLQLAKNELARKEELEQKKLISNSELEVQRTAVLIKEQQVWDAQQRLELIPTDKEVADANLNSASAKLQESQRKLDRTSIKMPFRGRIGNINIALDQITNPQQVMFEAYDVKLMEVTANISVEDISMLINSTSGETIAPGQSAPDIRNLGLTAQVRYTLGSKEFKWQASVDRLADSIDTKANTMGITVQVENDAVNYNPKIQPPLLKDMYVRIDITAPGKPAFVVPENSIQQDKLFIIDSENRLKVVPVSVSFSLNGYSVIEAEVNEGDRVVTTDLLVPVEGMLLIPSAKKS